MPTPSLKFPALQTQFCAESPKPKSKPEEAGDETLVLRMTTLSPTFAAL